MSDPDVPDISDDPYDRPRHTMRARHASKPTSTHNPYLNLRQRPTRFPSPSSTSSFISSSNTGVNFSDYPPSSYAPYPYRGHVATVELHTHPEAHRYLRQVHAQAHRNMHGGHPHHSHGHKKRFEEMVSLIAQCNFSDLVNTVGLDEIKSHAREQYDAFIHKNQEAVDLIKKGAAIILMDRSNQVYIQQVFEILGALAKSVGNEVGHMGDKLMRSTTKKMRTLTIGGPPRGRGIRPERGHPASEFFSVPDAYNDDAPSTDSQDDECGDNNSDCASTSSSRGDDAD